MSPLPKRKLSKGRKNRRRAHLALNSMNLIACPSCKKLKRAHEVCKNCGKYDSKEIIATK